MSGLFARTALRIASHPLERPPDGVEVDIVHPLLQRNDGIVGDLDVLRTHLCAALRDVAVAHARLSFQKRPPVEDIARMHLETRDPDHEPRPVEHALLVVLTQHVADVLAEEALDALAELHAPLDILLLHPPWLAGGQVLYAGGERRDLLVDLVVPADV